MKSLFLKAFILWPTTAAEHCPRCPPPGQSPAPTLCPITAGFWVRGCQETFLISPQPWTHKDTHTPLRAPENAAAENKRRRTGPPPENKQPFQGYGPEQGSVYTSFTHSFTPATKADGEFTRCQILPSAGFAHHWARHWAN